MYHNLEFIRKIVKTIELKGGAALKQVTSFLSQVSFDARNDLSRDTKAHFIISLLSNSRRDPGELSTSTFRVLFMHHVHLMNPHDPYISSGPRGNVRWLPLHFYTISIVRSQHEIS